MLHLNKASIAFAVIFAAALLSMLGSAHGPTTSSLKLAYKSWFDNKSSSLSTLGNQLLYHPASLQPPQQEAYNASLCAIVTNEDDFVDEWLIYHRLLYVHEHP